MSDTPELPPQNPFSTALAWKIITLMRERDLALLRLRNDYQNEKITKEHLMGALEEADTNITDAVLKACTKSFATLEATVNSVLEINAQMKHLREMAAGGIDFPGITK